MSLRAPTGRDRWLDARMILLIAAAAVSLFGTSFTQMYGEIYVYDRTRSNFYTSLLTVATFGAGVISSVAFLRFHRRLSVIATLVVCEILSAINVFGLAFLHRYLVCVYLAVAAIDILQSFSSPTYSSALYLFTPSRRQIAKTNALDRVLSDVAMGAGWMVAPLVYAHVGFAGLLIADGATYLTSALLLGIVWFGRPPDARDTENTSDADDAGAEAAGTSEVAESGAAPGVAASVIGFYLLATALWTIVTSLEIGTFRFVYGMSDRWIGIFLLLWVIGGAVGAVVAGRMRAIRLGPIAQGLAVMTCATVALPVAGKFGAGVCYAVIAAAFAFLHVALDSMIHSRIPASLHRRTFALLRLMEGGVIVVLAPASGLLADNIGLPWTFAALVALIASVAVVLSARFGRGIAR